MLRMLLSSTMLRPTIAAPAGTTPRGPCRSTNRPQSGASSAPITALTDSTVENDVRLQPNSPTMDLKKTECVAPMDAAMNRVTKKVAAIHQP